MLAVKIAVIESERGWGRKVDDYMICLSVEDAEKFNSENTEKTTPSWYMMAEGIPESLDVSDKQMKLLKKHKRIWWSILKDIK